MFQVPISLAMRYQAHFASKRIDANRLGEYKKWLQFFLDFCEKYQIIGDNAHRLRMFINKLKEKKQSEDQRRFAGGNYAGYEGTN